MKKTEQYDVEENRYIIDQDTMAVVPYLDDDERYGTMVMKTGSIDYLPGSVYRIMDDSCRYFGSTLRGRAHATSRLINAAYKCPIVIEPTLRLYFFPTTSPFSNQCVWISLFHVKHYYAQAKRKTVVVFMNDTTIVINISSTIFQQQLLRTTQLYATFTRQMATSLNSWSFIAEPPLTIK